MRRIGGGFLGEPAVGSLPGQAVPHGRGTRGAGADARRDPNFRLQQLGAQDKLLAKSWVIADQILLDRQ